MEGKYDLFTKVSDRRDIVDFVKEVERYPCLYDKTLPDYANKVHNRRAWNAIAKKINTTVPDCRDKWRKIRISFMRSLKQQHSDKPPMRPYYLSEDLQFLRPFLKINPKSPSQKVAQMDCESPIQKHEITDSDSADSLDIEIAEEEPEINRMTYKDTNSIIQERPKENVVYIKQNSRNSYNEEKQVNNSYRDEKPYGKNIYGDEKQHGRSIIFSDDIEANPRKMFLLSLLPEVECFSESEMRSFRREVIGICDGIMNKRMIRN